MYADWTRVVALVGAVPSLRWRKSSHAIARNGEGVPKAFAEPETICFHSARLVEETV